MTDSHPPQSIEWLDWYNQQYGPPQKDPAAVPRLTRAIADYLNWMKSVNYTAASQQLHQTQLELFLNFVKRSFCSSLFVLLKTLISLAIGLKERELKKYVNIIPAKSIERLKSAVSKVFFFKFAPTIPALKTIYTFPVCKWLLYTDAFIW